MITRAAAAAGCGPGRSAPDVPGPGERREAQRRAGAICSPGRSGGGALAPRGWRRSQRRLGQPAAEDAASRRRPAGRSGRRRGAPVPRPRARRALPPRPASPSCAPGRGCGTMAAPSPSSPASPPPPSAAPASPPGLSRPQRGERREGARSLLAAAGRRRGDGAGRVWSRRAPRTLGGSAASRAQAARRVTGGPPNGAAGDRGFSHAAPGVCFLGKVASWAVVRVAPYILHPLVLYHHATDPG